MREIKFEAFEEKDIPELTGIMQRAFDNDSRIHLGRAGGPPGYDNGDFLRKWGLNERSTQYKLILDGRMIGGVILWIDEKTHIHTLGTIFLDPDLQEKGIGTTVWYIIEKMYPDTIKWRTETPVFSHRNHHFYVNKCGFHVVRIENPRDWTEGSFILEKDMKNCAK